MTENPELTNEEEEQEEEQEGETEINISINPTVPANDLTTQSDNQSDNSEESVKSVKEKFYENIKTPNERIEREIIDGIGSAGEGAESQKSIRLYMILSYLAKIGLGLIGYFKLQAYISAFGLAWPF